MTWHSPALSLVSRTAVFGVIEKTSPSTAPAWGAAGLRQ
ncbi:hypothetical protein CHKEEEPN_3581 [Methylorubrum podarium]|nr:hypothetical protein CHKEEEPN_3581 [Methylorubrum podarium]